MFNDDIMKVYSPNKGMSVKVKDFVKKNNCIEFLTLENGSKSETIKSTEDSWVIIPTKTLHKLIYGEIVENKQEKIKEEAEIETSEDEVEEDVSEENESNKFITKRKR